MRVLAQISAATLVASAMSFATAAAQPSVDAAVARADLMQEAERVGAGADAVARAKAKPTCRADASAQDQKADKAKPCPAPARDDKKPAQPRPR